MPYPFSAGDKVQATEYNEVVKAAGLYAADGGASDAYAITLTPAPSSYIAGMVFRFKANTVNTGGATLNVNSLGAKSILRPDGSALANGDIVVGQIVTVIYDGTNLIMLSPVVNAPKYAHGVTSRDITAASGTQTIPHGLGRPPRRVEIEAIRAGNPPNFSHGVYDGSTVTTIYSYYNNAVANAGTTTAEMVFVYAPGPGGSHLQEATISVDATDIILNWTKTGTPDPGTINMRWKAEV